MVKSRKSTGFGRLGGLLPDHSGVIEKLTTNSVMSPLLLMMGIAITTIVAGAVLMDGMDRRIFVWLVVVIVVYIMAMFSYFARSNPDRLQSEEYLVAKQQMQLMRETGKPPATLDLAANTVANPAVQEASPVEETK